MKPGTTSRFGDGLRLDVHHDHLRRHRGLESHDGEVVDRAKKQSAEVIAEAPCCTLSGGILPLTNFGTVTFKNAMANGSALGATSPARINMVTTSGTTKASTSALHNGKMFHVAWNHADRRPGRGAARGGTLDCPAPIV